MKMFRKMLKLLPPAFAMRIWLDWRYGIKVKPVPWGGLVGFALAVLPYAFTAALSVRVDSDCRLLKYFLPYGKMKNFVRLAYGLQRGNAERDRGMVGMFRAIMPYGLVLWWDADDAQKAPSEGTHKNPVEATALGGGPSFDADRRLSAKAREELLRTDRIEAMTLRLLIMTEGGKRRNMACGGLPSFEEVFFKAPAQRAWDRWTLMDDKPLVVDMIFSVGGDCIAAFQQRNRNLRPYSLPFDWCFSDGEAALANFASMLDNGFRDFALLENMQAIPGIKFGYKDVKSGYSFIHHFKASIETPGEYSRFDGVLRRRIGRFYAEIERSQSILCLLSRTWMLKDSCLDPLRNVMRKKWPGKKFHYVIVTYNSTPPQVETYGDVSIVRIPRDRTAYDMKERAFEWSFLDNVRFSEDATAHFKAMWAQESRCANSAQH